MKALIAASMCGCLDKIMVLDTIDKPFITENSSYEYGETEGFLSEGGDFIYVPENVNQLMEPKKFSELTNTAITAMVAFTGIRDNGDDTFTNFNFTASELVSWVLAQSRAIITTPADGATLTDEWLDTHAITEIVLGGQSYLVGEAFTQAGDTITRIAMQMPDFTLNQKVKLIQ